jgi:hypothetical protein
MPKRTAVAKVGLHECRSLVGRIKINLEPEGGTPPLGVGFGLGWGDKFPQDS